MTEGRTGRPISLLFVAVLGGFMGQTIIFPILAPLSREVGLSEFQLGLLITLAALVVVLASPFWGRVSDARGRKPVLLTGMVVSSLGLYAFAAVSGFGLAGVLSVPVIFALMITSRGVLFGAGLAAVPVSAQAYVADVTPGEKERTSGIAAVGAAQGLALVLGPALGGVLAGFGLLVPLYVAPTLVLLVAALVWLRLPPAPERKESGPTPRLSPLDGRLWPFLVVGFGLFLSLSVTQITIGFLFQDRLALSARETAQAAGFGLFAAGIALVLAQAVLVPRLGWPPLRLMRSGIPMAFTGFVLLTFAQNFWLITLALALLGFGLGLSIPGYTAAPTLLVASGEQGGVAGLIAATNALTFVVGPLVGTALYGLAPGYPYIVSAVLISALFVFVLLHPGVRQVAAANARGPESPR